MATVQLPVAFNSGYSESVKVRRHQSARLIIKSILSTLRNPPLNADLFLASPTFNTGFRSQELKVLLKKATRTCRAIKYKLARQYNFLVRETPKTRSAESIVHRAYSKVCSKVSYLA